MLDLLDGKGPHDERGQEEELEEDEEQEKEPPPTNDEEAGPSGKAGEDDSDEDEDEDAQAGNLPVPFNPDAPLYSHISEATASHYARQVSNNESLEAKLRNMRRGNLGTGRFAGVFDSSTFIQSSSSGAPKALTYQPQEQESYQMREERRERLLEAQRKHQRELIMQQCEYGPLGVKLWFSKEESAKPDSEEEEETAASKPNRAPEEDHVIHHNDQPEFSRKDPEEVSFTKKEFTIQEPVKPIVPETLEEFLANVIMKETYRRIDKKAKKREKKRLEALRDQMARGEREGRDEIAGEGKSMADIDDLLKKSKEEEPDFICKMCNLVFVSRKHYEVHKVR